jgi:hypothetical protein
MVQAVRNSLKEDTRQIFLTLKPSADTKEIVQKFEQIYGNVKTSDRIAQDFYSATQKENEHCPPWAV